MKDPLTGKKTHVLLNDGLSSVLEIKGLDKALKIFNLDSKSISFESITTHNYLKKGNNINKIDILFKKIEKKND